ncbi:YqaA family protein [Candidatus Nitrosacidococcus sp. I8]|uniref:YqaA family protein n=1 Tax=Candidatus Nitrosacidococcus sp. I8 TaxID=2942908 RepID=UPI002226C013|nr:YqaA family protein [Candidatus Nitrosacidococcus sp. I8]CAH9019395.1 Inner membrane protein YqaA [Candidatus Nitrosacidococcus sp. I8]
MTLWGLFLSGFLGATLLPGGSEGVFAWLILHPSYSPQMLIGVATVGNTLGGMVTFLMGWWLEQKIPQGQIAQAAHQKAIAWIQRYGSVALLGAWLPVIGDPLCLVAGWLKINPWPAFFFMALGKGIRYVFLWQALA